MEAEATAKLTKKQCVLHDDGTCWDFRDGIMRRFVNSDYGETRDKGIVPGVEVAIPIRVWEDFGCPKEITVTIEPGDLLNEGEASAEG